MRSCSHWRAEVDAAHRAPPERVSHAAIREAGAIRITWADLRALPS